MLPQIQDQRILCFQTYLFSIVFREYKAVGENIEQMTTKSFGHLYSDKYSLQYGLVAIRS